MAEEKNMSMIICSRQCLMSSLQALQKALNNSEGVMGGRSCSQKA